MNIDATWQTDSFNSESTSALGEKFGNVCRGGEVFLLASDLGGGKTTFIKGFAKGLGSDDQVGSPTYTISRVYKCRDDLYLHHFDFYRLDDPGIVAHELSEVIEDPKSIVAIEWGDIVSDVLPDRAVVIKIDRLSDNEEHRRISVSCPPESSYIMENIK